MLELKIAPSGQVIDLRIISSELKAPELERKLLARIRQFDFGAKDVDQMVGHLAGRLPAVVTPHSHPERQHRTVIPNGNTALSSRTK